MKNPLTLAGIEPATSRFVAQHLNRGPQKKGGVKTKKGWETREYKTNTVPVLKINYCVWDEMERSCIRNEWRHAPNETRKLQDEEQGEDGGDAGQGIVTPVLVWSFLTSENKNKNSIFIWTDCIWILLFLLSEL